MPTPHKTMFKGLLGTASGFGSWWINHLSWLDPALQTTGMLLGIIVAVLTSISFCFDIRHKWLNRNKK